MSWTDSGGVTHAVETMDDLMAVCGKAIFMIPRAKADVPPKPTTCLSCLVQADRWDRMEAAIRIIERRGVHVDAAALGTISKALNGV